MSPSGHDAAALELESRDSVLLPGQGFRRSECEPALATDAAIIDLAAIERGEIPVPVSVAPFGLGDAPAWKLGVKRAIDIIGALLLLLVTLPILVVTALAVAVSTPGPVFYVQERVGRGGRHFRMVKFRSMFVDADARLPDIAYLNQKSGPIFKLDNDPRVTRVGRWIRRFSIDELPQLFNVLRGDMSMVGPRPPLPREVVEYRPTDCQRLSVTPGLTCIWQVSGRSELDFDEWVQMDIEYIRDWSIGLDLRLMLQTIPAIVSAKGAY